MKFSSMNIRMQILVSITAPLVLLLMVGGWTIHSNNAMLETSWWVDYTNKVIADGKALTVEAVNMETGLRGYLLAGDEVFLEPYNSGEEKAFKLLVEMKNTVNHNPRQVERLDEVETILREWKSKVAEDEIQLRREINKSKSMNDMASLVAMGSGKERFDQLRKQVQRFQEDGGVRMQQARRNFGSIIQTSGSEAEKLQKAFDRIIFSQQVNDAGHVLLTEAINMETGVRGFLITGNESFLEPFRDGKDDFFKHQKILEELIKDNPEQMKILDEVTVVARQWLVNHVEPAINLRRQILAGKDMEDMSALVGQALGKTYFDQFRKLMKDFNAEEVELLVERKAVNEELTSLTTLAMIVSVILATVMLAVGFLVVRNISNSLTEIISVVSTTTTQLATTADEHERVALKQAAAVTQIVTTMAELNSSARQSSEQAGVAVNSASQALKVAAEGRSLIDETMQGMAEVKKKSNIISEQILLLSEQTGQIGGITRLVTDIASQTNLLALNASVEAAHAGEHGKGFAVVASEIRKLADQSKKSAEHINTLVEEIQKATNTTIMAAEQGSMTIDKGNDLAQAVASAFKRIVDTVNSSYENMQQIALNSKQQSDATGQVADGMTGIEAGASETSAGIGQTRVGLRNLDKVAQNLRQKI